MAPLYTNWEIKRQEHIKSLCQLQSMDYWYFLGRWLNSYMAESKKHPRFVTLGIHMSVYNQLMTSQWSKVFVCQPKKGFLLRKSIKSPKVKSVFVFMCVCVFVLCDVGKYLFPIWREKAGAYKVNHQISRQRLSFCPWFGLHEDKGWG